MYKKLIVVGVSVCLLHACVKQSANVRQPINRAEFVELVRQGKGFTKTEEFTVERPIDTVIQFIDKHANQCFNVRVIGRYASNPKVIATNQLYRYNFDRVGKNHAELTLFVNDYILVAVNFIGLSSRSTRMEFFRPPMYRKQVENIRAWAEGQNAPCAKFY